MSIDSYQDLDVWQRAMTLAEEAYALTRHFPREEQFGMTSQIRRAASSVPANIAEGWARNSTGEFLQFLRVAMGSLRELETHLLLSQRVGLTTEDQIQSLLETINILSRQLLALQRSLRQKKRK
ncbi:MAG: four helix bundle protein [Chloroflexi bacterium]|nr:four helix bundle protein [Chloroflexota bacterium]